MNFLTKWDSILLKLSKYFLYKLICRSSQGKVYKVVHKLNYKVYAMKIIEKSKIDVFFYLELYTI